LVVKGTGAVESSLARVPTLNDGAHQRPMGGDDHMFALITNRDGTRRKRAPGHR
jgi:hypothetical protein